MDGWMDGWMDGFIHSYPYYSSIIFRPNCVVENTSLNLTISGTDHTSFH
jgi:hypothetical protein